MKLADPPSSPNAPANDNHLLITKSVPSKTVSELTDQELIVLAMIDRFAPHAGAHAWPCDWLTLVQWATDDPKVDEGQLMNAIGRMVGFKVLDICIGSDDRHRAVIWASRYMHRGQLRNAFMTDLCNRIRRNHPATADTSDTAAA